jgi:hypothetical protein
MIYRDEINQIKSNQTKQAMKKKNILCTTNMYILKLLLSIVTAETEGLVMLGIKILHACVK